MAGTHRERRLATLFIVGGQVEGYRNILFLSTQARHKTKLLRRCVRSPLASTEKNPGALLSSCYQNTPTQEHPRPPSPSQALGFYPARGCPGLAQVDPGGNSVQARGRASEVSGFAKGLQLAPSLVPSWIDKYRIPQTESPSCQTRQTSSPTPGPQRWLSYRTAPAPGARYP